MKGLLTPTWTLNTPYDLKAADLLAHGIQGVIVDLDNTLLAWNVLDHTDELSQWILELRNSGVQAFLLSNNTTERVRRVAEPLDIPFQANALKPRRDKFKIAIDYMQLPKEEIVVIGDQIMTDVIGANRKGLRSILVKPIVKSDIIWSFVNRRLERLVFYWLGIDPTTDWGTTLDG